MKNHLKRIAAPRTWQLARKSATFTLRPFPGGQGFEMGLALGSILRDHLHLASSMNEVQKMLHVNKILVDGKLKKDRRSFVGLFDIISIPKISKHFQINLDSKGRLIVQEIVAAKADSKVCRVIGKTLLKGGKIQLNLYDGKNIVSTKDVNVGDSIVLTFPQHKIQKVLPLTIGAHIFLTHGKHAGTSGTLKELSGKSARYELKDGTSIETARKYIFVVE
jgi:small subunit ribosomal protein S4e